MTMTVLLVILAVLSPCFAVRWPNPKYCMPTDIEFPPNVMIKNFTGLPFFSSTILEASLSPLMDIYRTEYTVFGVTVENGQLRKKFNWTHPLPGTRVSVPAIDHDGKVHFIAFSDRRPSSIMTYLPSTGVVGKTKIGGAQVEYYGPELHLYGNNTLLLSSLVMHGIGNYSAILQSIDLTTGNENWRIEKAKPASQNLVLRVGGDVILWLYGDRLWRIDAQGKEKWEFFVERKDPDPRKGASTLNDFQVIAESRQIVSMGFSAGCFYLWNDLETGKPLTNRVYINCDGGGSVGIQRILVDQQVVYFIGAMDMHAYNTKPGALPTLIFNVPSRGIAALTCGPSTTDIVSFSYPANVLYRWDGQDGDYKGKWSIPGGSFGKRCNGGGVFGDKAAVFNCKDKEPETLITPLSLVV